MKKIIAITLAVLMAAMTFIFAGCGDKKTATDSDLEYVKNNGKLVIGITDFDPMDYKDANGEWIGFDADLARKVCEKLGVTAEFKVITWGQKENELNTKSIDAIWNGMTITDAIKNVGDVSGAYMTNYQVVVVKDAKYTTVESLAGQTIVAEQGSAGESAIQANATLSKSYKPVESQSDALLQVQSGQAAACVIDYVMAGSMLVEGKTYSNLSIMKDVKLGDDESYGIAFRKGSDIVAAVNTALSELVADGTVKTIAEKYGLQDSIVTDFQATKKLLNLVKYGFRVRANTFTLYCCFREDLTHEHIILGRNGKPIRQRLFADPKDLCDNARFRPAARIDYQLRLKKQISAASLARKNHCLDSPRHSAYAPAYRFLLRTRTSDQR